MSLEFVLIGAGGHAISITNLLHSNNNIVINYVDNELSGKSIMGTPIITIEECVDTYNDQNFCIAIGDNFIREKVSKEIRSLLPNAKFPAIIHNSSVIGIEANIGEGSVVMPQCNIGPRCSVGDFCIVNSNSSIDHDCDILNFSSIAPGVNTGGNVKIGYRSAICIGSVIKQAITIGDDVVVGANSYVNINLENNIIAMGTPIKKYSDRKKGDSYLL